MGCTIIGCGKALPALSISNDNLAQLVDTSDEWIFSRTGIKNRRIAVHETGTDLSEAAARQALGWNAGGFSMQHIQPDSVDLVIFATMTPDALTPSCAALLCRRLGLSHAVAFDLNAACSGFIYGLSVAESMIAASCETLSSAQTRPPMKRALIIGAERLSRITNWEDRNTCVLFGDGAGAVLVEWNDQQPGIMSSFMANADDTTGALTCPAGYEAAFPFDSQGIIPPNTQNIDPALSPLSNQLQITATPNQEPWQSFRMDGQRVFKFAANAMSTAIITALDRAQVPLEDVKCIIPHQANERIIKFAAKKLGVPLSLFQISITQRGNSSAACVPMTLADAYKEGRIQPGDKVVLVAFGGGFTSGAIVYEA